MTCGIYMIQNKANGKIYIGKSGGIEKRWGKHKWALRSNRHHNEHLQHAWNRYGEDNFEFTIICKCDKSQLNTMEKAYISKLRANDQDFGYNLTDGGEGCSPTEKTRKKMSESQKGKTHSEKTRKKISEAHKGKTHSEKTRKKISENNANRRPEVRKKISEANKGRIVSEETRKKIGEAQKGEKNHMYGKPHLEKTRKKISESLKGENAPWYGKHLPEDTRKKISEAHKGKLGIKCPNSIPVVRLTLDGQLVNIYGSAQEAGRNGFTTSAVNSCCKNKFNRAGNNTYKGYKWMYLSEYEAMKKEG